MRVLRASRYLASLCAFGACTVGAHPADRRASPKTIPLYETFVNVSSLRRRQDTPLSGGPLYRGNVDVGDSGTQLSVILDTGSTDLVLNPDYFSNDASMVQTSQSCNERYSGGGSGSGTIWTGPYSFAGFNANGAFCETELGSTAKAGVMGLGYPNAGVVSTQTNGDCPLSQFNGQGLNSFAIYFSQTPGGGGAFTPNDYNQAYIYDGAPFATENVDNTGGHWKFGAANYQFNGGTYSLDVANMIVDTGAPYIEVGPNAIGDLWSRTGADTSGSYGGNCNPGGDPIVVVANSGNTYTLTPNVYVIRDPANAGNCISAFRQSTSPDIENGQGVLGVLGTPFVKAYYTYFDINNEQLSFAQSGG